MIKPYPKYKQHPNLKEKNVLIVGGTDGIGKELALLCHFAGAKVITIGRHRDETLAENGIPQVIEDVLKHPERIEPLYIGSDYVLNNIGMYYRGSIEETSADTFRRVLEANLIITHILTGYALKHMDGGVLVNMASRPTLEKYKDWSAYTLAKQGVITLTQAAAEEGNLNCYAVCPSRVDTKFRDELFPDEDTDLRLSPESVAELIYYLFNGLNESGKYYWIKELCE